MLFLRQYLTNECYVSVSAKLLGQIYNVSDGNARKIICRANKIQNKVGRPFIFAQEIEILIVQEISSKRNTHEFMTIPEILRYIEETFNKVLSRGWANTFIDRHKEEIEKAIISPQDQSRLEIPRSYLIRYLDIVELLIDVAPAELVYNIDETGLSDWEERKPKTVVIPKGVPKEQLHYPVNRGNRHVTLLVTISAGGDAYFPMAITSDPNLVGIFDLGIRKDVDLTLKISNSSYVNKEIFNDHIINYFIPQVIKDRECCGFVTSPAILFFDNCSSHLDENLLKILAKNLIIVISYPSHTSNVFQVLDILLFGVLKNHKKYLPKNDNISPKIDHLYRIFHSYELSTCSTTVRSSFVKAGFNYIKKGGSYFLQLNREKIEKSPSFQELWDINFPEEDLSTRRKNQKWGWINKEYFPKKFQKKYPNL